MSNEDNLEKSDHDWRSRRLAFPRLGLLMDRNGVRTRVIWPGLYHVRKSRSFGKWIYRRSSPGSLS